MQENYVVVNEDQQINFEYDENRDDFELKIQNQNIQIPITIWDNYSKESKDLSDLCIQSSFKEKLIINHESQQYLSFKQSLFK